MAPLTVILILVALVLAVGGAWVVATKVHADAASERDAAVDAAVRAVLDQAGHALALEREATVRAAVDTVLSVASDKLGDTVTAGSRELDLRSHAFERQVVGVADELSRLGTLVQSLQTDAASQHGSMVEHLRQVAVTQSSLAEHTQSLREALASPKQRGQWGERMAEDVLRAAGFKPGINYRRQTAINGGTIPDFTFLLPNDLEIRMDVKFPVDNYLRVLDADTDHDVDRFRKAFVRDVRARIKELSGRDYADARDTVDCVVLFIPNESVYAFVHESDAQVLDVAMAQGVVLCSPSTLFAVLAVIRRSVEQFRLARVSDDILRCLGGVNDQWQRFAGHLDLVEKRLQSLTNGFDDLQGVRRRQFEKTLNDVTRLSLERDVPAGAGEAEVAVRAAGDVRALRLGDVG